MPQSGHAAIAVLSDVVLSDVVGRLKPIAGWIAASYIVDGVGPIHERRQGHGTDCCDRF